MKSVKRGFAKAAVAGLAVAALAFTIGLCVGRVSAGGGRRGVESDAAERAMSASLLRGGVFPEDDMKAAAAISEAAKRGDANTLFVARAWAGDDVTRRFWVCDIVRNAGRTNELAELARDAVDACRGDAATFARLLRAAKFLEECRDWTTARDALERAAPLAAKRTQREDLEFAVLRVELASEGPTNDRIERLGRIASSAAMNDNRIAASRMMEAYGR